MGLSVLLNAESLQPRLGKELTQFKEFTAPLDPKMRGLSISNQEKVRQVHNSFARQSSFSFEKDPQADKEDAFHFVAYVPHQGKVYELDGLRRGPMEIGPISGTEKNSWMNTVKPEIRERMEKYQASGAGEIRFNLLSMQYDPSFESQQELLAQRFARQRAQIKLVSLPENDDEDLDIADEDLDDDDAPAGVLSIEELPDELAPLKAYLAEVEGKIQALTEELKDNTERRNRWKQENERRRHDYVPFLLCAIKHLARQGVLLPAFQTAKTAAEKKAAEKSEAKKKRKKNGKKKKKKKKKK